ncbi:MAG: DNA topoisomerase IB [Acidimicrobiia bacterium]
MVDDQAIEDNADAGLVYVTDQEPGIGRRRRGRGFSYRDPKGWLIDDAKHLQHIRSLAIPPAWSDVWICPQRGGHLQATGRDARGRKQYRYHPDWRLARSATKFDRMGEFGLELPRLRSAVDEELGRPGLSHDRVVALVVRLLDETLVRIGNDEYVEANASYGLTTLRHRHVELGSTVFELTFPSKGGLERRVKVVDRRLARLVRRCHELGGQRLFMYLDGEGNPRPVDSGDVNRYLHEVTERHFTSKDFRTWGATAVAAGTLGELGPPGSLREGESKFLAAIDASAAVLGNTRAVCRRSYVHPVVQEAYLESELDRHWGRARAGASMAREERLVLALLDA